MDPSADGREIIAAAYRLAIITITGREPGCYSPDHDLTRCLLAGIIDLAITGQSDPEHLARHAVRLCRGATH